MSGRKSLIWTAWILATLGLVAYFAYRLVLSDDQSLFLLGDATHGHHQIELSCDACHTSPFGGDEVLQNACMDCHGEALSAANDTHPASKFNDPRNADRLEQVDAQQCVTCHTEHKPGRTGDMAVTIPKDFCFHCHEDVDESRSSHEGLEFMTCTDAGCHNYHDNQALYEDFLLRHAEAPDFLPDARVAIREVDALTQDRETLTAADADAPENALADTAAVDEWHHSAHAEAGVNCMDCHTGTEGADDWLVSPDYNTCADCHAEQVGGWQQGMHGMRTAVGLSPMRPELANRPMREEAHGEELGCMSCHDDHAFDTREAAVDACLSCHTDDHSRAYLESPHYALWQQEMAGDAEPGTGVSCATCHMPRETHRRGGEDVIVIQHNQNRNLRPVEKMARSTCMSCHGLPFTLDALADEALLKNNFQGMPTESVPSVDWAEKRLRRQQEEREQGEAQ